MAKTKYSLAIRFIKFSVIGLSGMIVNSGILWILHTYAELSIYLASPIAIVFAIFNNFSLNNHFTWNENKANSHNNYRQRLWKYYASASLGSLINYVVLLVLTMKLGLYYLVGNILGILLGTVSNFLLSEFWVFKIKEPE